MAAPRTCFLDPGRDYVRVKTGFSWPAFFLGSLWAALVRRGYGIVVERRSPVG